MGLSDVESIHNIGKTRSRTVRMSAACTNARVYGRCRKVLLKGDPLSLIATLLHAHVPV